MMASAAILSMMVGWLTAAKIKDIPYLYLSANDGDVAYVDVTNYFALDFMIDPYLQSDDEKNIQLLQPFSNKTLNYDAFKTKIGPKSFSNCTAASYSEFQYSAMVCKGNFLYLMAIDEVIAIDQLKAEDASCSLGGSMSCYNIIFDAALTAGYVMCVKSNESSTSIVGYGFQYLQSSASISKKTFCYKLLDKPMNESGISKLRSDIVAVQYSQDSTPEIQVANITIVVQPYSDAPTVNDYGQILKIRILMKFGKQGVTIVSTSMGTRNLADLITPGSVIKRLYGSTSTRFSNLYQSNTLFVVTTPNSKVESPVFDTYFIKTTTVDDYGFQIIKKVSMNYDLPALVTADNTYFMSITFNQTQSGYCRVKVTVIDIYSLFSENTVMKSALIYEYVEFNIYGKNESTPAKKINSVQDFRDLSDHAVLKANQLMASLWYRFESGEEAIVIIDLASISVKRINVTGYDNSIISLSANADQPIALFNYLDKQSGRYQLSIVSSSRCFMGIKKLKTPEFSYVGNLFGEQGNSGETDLKNDQFYLKGIFIGDMASFIDVNQMILNQQSSYYANLTYNLFLPWDGIRGADITLKNRLPSRSKPSLTAYKYYGNSIVLDTEVNVPESYFICENYLVLLDTIYTQKIVRIMIFKYVNESRGDNRYNSVTNYTLPFDSKQTKTISATLKTVKVYYDNIICLLLVRINPDSKFFSKNTLMLVSFFGPNYLRSQLTFDLDWPEFDATIQPNTQTSAYFVVSTSQNVIANSLFLDVWDIQPEDLTYSVKLVSFNRYSNVQPEFCPVGLNQDLVDNKLIIIKSYCGVGYRTYSMQLDLTTLLITEFQKDQLIDKTGDICPSKESFVKIFKGKLKGYKSCPGKAIVNEMEYYTSDLDLTKPYDMTCSINLNLLVIGQKNFDPKGKYYAVYFFHTDKSLEADKRLDQRIRIDADIGLVNIVFESGMAYIHYTDKSSGTIGKITVLLSATKVYSSFEDVDQKIWPMYAEIDLVFMTHNNITNNHTMTVRYDKPKYSPVISKNVSTRLAPSCLNNTQLDLVSNIQGPVFYPMIMHGSTLPKSRLESREKIWLQDLVKDANAIIRAPIFNNFDIFISAGMSVIGVVNYPYGFDICVFDSQYLQDPVVTPFLGSVAIEAKAIFLKDTYYLFVKARAIGDTMAYLKLYKATTDDLIFSGSGTFSNPLMKGQLSVILSEETTPSFIAMFFCREKSYIYFFIIRFKQFDSVYPYLILPDISIANIIQMQVIEARPLQSAVLIYRKIGDFKSFFTRTINLDIFEIHAEQLVKSDALLLNGPNENIACSMRSSSDHIDCIMTIEGDEFLELVLNLEMPNKKSRPELMGKIARHSQTVRESPEYTLSVNSTKIYNHYLNSVCESIAFSEQFIILQTLMPFTAPFMDNRRYMMIYDRTSYNPHLYRGIECSEYSNSCSRPVDIVVGSGRDFYVAAESEDFLVLNFTFLPRVIKLKSDTSFTIENASQWNLVIMNLFNPQEIYSQPLDQVVNFSEFPKHKNLKFNWLPGTLMILPLLCLVLYALVREQRTLQKQTQLIPKDNEKLSPSRTNSMPLEKAEDSVPAIFNNISLMDKSRQREEADRFYHEIEEHSRIRTLEKDETMSEGSAQ